LDKLNDIKNWKKDENRKRCFFTTDFSLSKDVFYDEFLQPHYFGRIRDVRIQIFSRSNERLSAELSMDRNVLYTSNGQIENRIGVQTFATSTANSICGKYDFSF
jgi:hypothetical protein